MKLLALLTLLCAPLVGLAQTPYFPPVGGNVWDTVHPASLGWCQPQLDSLIDYVEATDGDAFLILKDGKIVVEEYFGTFTRDSFHTWNSAGKAMTAFLVGLAQEQGHLDINDSTAKHLGAGWTSCTPASEGAITIRHQLTMTAGLDETGNGTSDAHCTDDTCLACIAPPGTRWSYHNAPYTLLGAVIEAATGQTLNAYKNAQLLASTGIGGQYYPVGYNRLFVSKPRAMARFGLLVGNKGNWAGTQVMQDTAYFSDMINTSQSLNPSYGYLWWLNGKAGFRLPGTQMYFSGPLMPDAPADMVSALGKDDQLLNVVPSLGLVLVRMGGSMSPNPLDVATNGNNEIWKRLNKAMCGAVATSEADAALGFSLYPNPTSGVLNLSVPAGVGRFGVRVFDAMGRALMAVQNEATLDVSSLAPGVYMVRVDAAGGPGAVLRFVRQ